MFVVTDTKLLNPSITELGQVFALAVALLYMHCKDLFATKIFSSAPQFVIIYRYCCRQAQQPVLFCKHSSAPEKSVQHLCNIIVITQNKCTFLLNGGMTKTDQPVPRLCCCFHYTHLGPLCPLSRGKICFVTNWGADAVNFSPFI